MEIYFNFNLKNQFLINIKIKTSLETDNIEISVHFLVCMHILHHLLAGCISAGSLHYLVKKINDGFWKAAFPSSLSLAVYPPILLSMQHPSLALNLGLVIPWLIMMGCLPLAFSICYTLLLQGRFLLLKPGNWGLAWFKIKTLYIFSDFQYSSFAPRAFIVGFDIYWHLLSSSKVQTMTWPITSMTWELG